MQTFILNIHTKPLTCTVNAFALIFSFVLILSHYLVVTLFLTNLQSYKYYQALLLHLNQRKPHVLNIHLYIVLKKKSRQLCYQKIQM